MALLGRAARNLSGLLEKNAAGQFGDSTIPSNSALGGWSNPDGIVRSERGALAVGTVLNCVKVLYTDFRVLPFFAYTGDRQKVRAPLAVQPDIVTKPFGPDLSRSTGMGQIVASLALRGNAYLLVTQRDALRFPTQVRILHPDTVSVEQDKKTHAVQYKIDREPVAFDDIKHLRGLMLPGSLVGIDPVSYARSAWSLAASLQENGLNFFANGSSLGTVLSFPMSGDRELAKKLLGAWNTEHSGVFNAHKPAVLFGNGTVQQLGVAPEQAQFLQTKDSSREDICGWFGVPLQRIQVSGSSDNTVRGGKGLDAVDAGYVKHTLLDYATTIEACWDQMIPGDLRTWTRFDFDEFLRADASERAAIYQIHRVIDTMNRDEIRALEGLPPVPDGTGAEFGHPLNSNSTAPAGGVDQTPQPGGQDNPGGDPSVTK